MISATCALGCEDAGQYCSALEMSLWPGTARYKSEQYCSLGMAGQTALYFIRLSGIGGRHQYFALRLSTSIAASRSASKKLRASPGLKLIAEATAYQK